MSYDTQKKKYSESDYLFGTARVRALEKALLSSALIERMLDAPDEDPLVCAERELSEETGYTAARITKLTTIATTVGFSNEKIHLYAAEGLTAGKQHTDEDEFINVVKVPLEEAVAMAQDGRIVDAKSVISILMLAQQRAAK